MRLARRACALLGLALLLGLLNSGYAAAAPVTRPGLVVIGTGGFTWSQVTASATPNLWALLRSGASSTVSVRSVNLNTCPVDGWLALSAGERAAAPAANGAPTRDPGEGCPAIPEPVGGQVPGHAAYVQAAKALHYNAKVGLLGEQLAGAGIAATAVGPGAALGLASPQGKTDYLGFEDALADPNRWRAALMLVDVSAVRDPADLGRGEPAPPGDVASQLSAIDRRIGLALARVPEGSNVLVAALADGGQSARLRPVVAAGPNFVGGQLYSPSTRQRHLLQSSDVTATILALVGAPLPTNLGGGILRGRDAQTGGEDGAIARRQALIDLDLATFKGHALIPTFFTTVMYGQAAFYILVWGVWRRRLLPVGPRLRLVAAARVVAVAGSTVPVATFLANLLPWWRSDHPMGAVVGAVAIFVAAITAMALAPWPTAQRRGSLVQPLAVVGTVTALVLAVDVMTGSRLQISAMMGLQPVVGGRFYGMGNVTFALYATGVVMALIALSHRLIRVGRGTRAALSVGLLGLGALAIDAAPMWGADGGGPPAFLPGLAYFVLALLGVVMTLKRAATVGGLTVVFFLAIGFFDSLRPVAQQSHLGRFFAALGDGGALDVVMRKAQTNLENIALSYLTMLVPLALVGVIWMLSRPTSRGSRSLAASVALAPTLRTGLVAWLVVMTIGFLLNDSGVAIPAVGASVAIPLILSIATGAVLTTPQRPLGP